MASIRKIIVVLPILQYNLAVEMQKALATMPMGFIPSATDNDQEFIRGCTVSDDLTKVLGRSI